MGESKRVFEEYRRISNFEENDNLNGFYLPKKISQVNVIDFITSLVTKVESGNQNALDVFISFKKIADKIEEGKKKINDLAIKEMGDYTDGFYNGHKITIVDGRKSFDFKAIPEIQEKQKELKEIEEKYKDAYNGVQKGIVQLHNGEWVDENGELKPLPKPVYGKTYLKIEK